MKTFDYEKARYEAQGAEERRRHESMLEKQAMRLALSTRQPVVLKCGPAGEVAGNEKASRQQEVQR
jgi:hypothetical protein